MARLLFTLDAWIVKHPQVYELNPTMREAVMNEILNEFAVMLDGLAPKDIANKIEQYQIEENENE